MTGNIIVGTALAIFYMLGLIGVVKIWQIDCKKFGKENLAVPLSDRLKGYFMFFMLPLILVLLKIR